MLIFMKITEKEERENCNFLSFFIIEANSLVLYISDTK